MHIAQYLVSYILYLHIQGTHILSMSHVRTDLYLLQEGGGGAQTVDLVLVLLPVQSTHLPAKNRAGKSTGSQETFDESSVNI